MRVATALTTLLATLTSAQRGVILGVDYYPEQWPQLLPTLAANIQVERAPPSPIGLPTTSFCLSLAISPSLD